MISVSQELQGVTFYGDTLVLSRSNGRGYDSDIFFYKNPLNNTNDDTLTLLGQEVPHWYLTSDKLTNKVVNMPMSQAIVKNGDKLLLLYESGASEYKDNGGKNPTDRVWEITL